MNTDEPAPCVNIWLTVRSSRNGALFFIGTGQISPLLVLAGYPEFPPQYVGMIAVLRRSAGKPRASAKRFTVTIVENGNVVQAPAQDCKRASQERL
jgi:hypothetical protein